ncbi:MAG: dTMP kinase, partial [Campylobacter sp.]|nr:dTMP kinase [Campylobacter sp.]
MYILFEGIDGVGKSTQINLLANSRKDCIITKEPGGSELGVYVRKILLENEINLSKKAELLLFLADRAEHAKKLLQKNQDKIILSDRGFVSGIAYAKANDENLSFDELFALNKFALDGILPDKIIFFSTDENLLKLRLKNRATSDKIEARGIEYLLKVQNIMQEFLGKSDFKVLYINAKDEISSIH